MITPVDQSSTPGFTLIEVIVVIGIVLILLIIATPAFLSFRQQTTLNNGIEEIINGLRVAQDRTVASEGDSQYGAYFNTSTSPHQYTLFKGINYSSRDQTFDETYSLSDGIEIYDLNLVNQEIIFERLTGYASSAGNLSIRAIDNPARTKTIYIEPSGQVSQATSATSTDSGRLKDSRHVHFTYSRFISTSTESIILTFDDSPNPDVVEQFAVSDYLVNSQIEWEKTITVGSDDQTVKVATHRLNSPDTLFSVHRDLRYNDRALDIDIDGDAAGTPNLISYTDLGTTTQGLSAYVGSPEQQ